jgi:hypothetical protein
MILRFGAARTRVGIDSPKAKCFPAKRLRAGEPPQHHPYYQGYFALGVEGAAHLRRQKNGLAND